MEISLRITIAALGFIFVFWVFSLLTKKKINERNSLSWIIGSLLVVILVVTPQTLNVVAHFVGVDYPPTLLFLVTNIIMLIILLHQSIQISTLQSQNRELAQRLALSEFLAHTGQHDHSRTEK